MAGNILNYLYSPEGYTHYKNECLRETCRLPDTRQTTATLICLLFEKVT